MDRRKLFRTQTFSFDKPVRANTLVLSDANHSIIKSDHYDRPTRIEVIVNGQRNPQIVELSRRVLSSWTLKFKGTRVRSLEIRIAEREPGKGEPGIAGFSEVQLLYQR